MDTITANSESPEEVHVYDITSEANGCLNIISGAFTGDTLRGFMISLANSTVDPDQSSVFDFLIESLVIEEPENGTEEVSVILVLDIGELLEPNFDPSVDSLIEDLRIQFQP